MYLRVALACFCRMVKPYLQDSALPRGLAHISLRCGSSIGCNCNSAYVPQALTPLTIGRSNIKATLMGALWGFGHSIGQLILGLLMVLLKVSPIFRFAADLQTAHASSCETPTDFWHLLHEH